MYVYGIRQGDTFHYVGQTSSKLNIRFNWHVWAARHGKGGTLHDWMAGQPIASITVVVLAEADDPFELCRLEAHWQQVLLKAGHPLKTLSRTGVRKPPLPVRRGHTLTPEHKEALAEGRRRSGNRNSSKAGRERQWAVKA